MRTPYQRYREYHTSLDNKRYISFSAMAETIDTYLAISQLLEIDHVYFSTLAGCEPQLGKRGMYPSSVNPLYDRTHVHRMMHLLAYCDGTTNVIDIAERRDEFALLYSDIIERCIREGLIEMR